MTSICDHGACGDGRIKCTGAVQAAIDSCAAAGGGTVIVPPGVYVTGTIYLRSHVTLHLDAGATLLGSPDRDDYNADDCFPENNVFAFENVTGAHLVIAYRCTDVAITGTGRIDGNSGAFFETAGRDLTIGNRECRRRGEHFRIAGGHTTRLGQMVVFSLCRNVLIQGVQLLNAQYWTLFFHGCRDVRVDGLHIENPPQTPNGDGIDVDCCQSVTIANCVIRTADDCITLRANETPLKGHHPCRDVTVSNCTLSSKCNAIRVGVGNGVISHCTFSNVVIHDTRTGISINASIPSLAFSAAIEHVHFSDIVMDVQIPLYAVNSQGTDPLREGAGIRDIVVAGLQGTATAGMLVSGMPALPVRDIGLRDIRLELIEGSDNQEFLRGGVPYPVDGFWGAPGYETIPCALYVRHAEQVVVAGFHVRWRAPRAGWLDAGQFIDCRDVLIAGDAWRRPHADRGAAVRLRACRNVTIRGPQSSTESEAAVVCEDMPASQMRCEWGGSGNGVMRTGAKMGRRHRRSPDEEKADEKTDPC